MGHTAEKAFGKRNYMELFSVFDTPPLFTVYHGRTELGAVHQLTFQVKREGPISLSLGGHFWRVKHVDWNRESPDGSVRVNPYLMRSARPYAG